MLMQKIGMALMSLTKKMLYWHFQYMAKGKLLAIDIFSPLHITYIFVSDGSSRKPGIYVFIIVL